VRGCRESAKPGPGNGNGSACQSRNFSDIKDIYPFALRMVEEIQRLYLIERDLRLVNDDERRRNREARSIPQLSRIHQLLTMAKISALPASDLGIAIDYALSRWPALFAYAQHGFLPIDNDGAKGERADNLRPSLARVPSLTHGPRQGAVLVAFPEVEAMPQPVVVVLAPVHRHLASDDTLSDPLVATMEPDDEGRQAGIHDSSTVAGGELALLGDDPGLDEELHRLALGLGDRQLGQLPLAPTEGLHLTVDLLLLYELGIGHGG
jgi:hypothetical protein